MAVITWNFGVQVTVCTKCELKTYMNSSLGCQNNDKGFPTQAPS